jgi:hypothetical protein
MVPTINSKFTFLLVMPLVEAKVAIVIRSMENMVALNVSIQQSIIQKQFIQRYSTKMGSHKKGPFGKCNFNHSTI